MMLPSGLPNEAYTEEENIPTPYINPFTNQNYNVVDKQLETTPTLQQFRDQILGIKGWDKNGKPLIDDSLKMVNTLGAKSILIELYSALAPQSTLGYLKEDEVYRMAESFEKDLTLKLLRNKIVWEVSTAHRDVILSTAGTIYFTSLTRAINGATHKGITQVSMVHEQHIQREMAGGGVKQFEEKPNFFDWLGFKKRR